MKKLYPLNYFFKPFAVFLLLALMPNWSWGQISIPSFSTTAIQNFDGMGSSATATTPTGFKIGTDWASGTTVTTLAAGTSGTGVITSSSSGGTYNFANGVTASSTDRALGFLNSGSFTSPKSIVLAITNNTGSTITALNISFDYEKYRSGSRAFGWTFFHGATSAPTTAASVGDQAYAADASNTVVSNPPTTISKTVSLTGLSIANSANYYLLWTFTGVGGSTNGQGIGIDNFSITAPSLGPIIQTSPISISNLNYNLGSGPSTAGNYTLTGSNLTGNVTLTAPANFEISNTSATSGFSSGFMITPSSGSIGTTIYARSIAGLAAGAYSGNITHTGGGITATVNVALSGTVVDVSLPNISINDVTLTEGNSGTTNMTFTVSLSVPAPMGGVTFDIATANNTATAGTDYVAKTLTSQTIPAGSSSYTFDVVINGDLDVEPNETFFVNLTNVTNANVTDTQGLGTITNDDAASMITKISAIQGSGSTAALTGARTIEGIVTRTFFGTSKLTGFYVQEEDADSDGDPLTSEGIFVYDPAGLFIGNSGDKVLLSGTVTEFTSTANGITSSLTELTTLTAASVVSTGNPLPTVVNVQFPVANVSDLERYEGMLVNASASTGNLTVTEYFQLGRYGQVVLSATGATNQAGTDARLDQYTQFNAPSVSGYSAYLVETAKRKIILDDGSTVQNTDPILFGRGGNPLSASNTLRGGDEVASITAILDERLEGYRLQTTTGVNFIPTNARPTTPIVVGGTLKAASFNILNYFNGDGMGGGFPTPRGADNATEFTRQRNKTIQAIIQSGVDVLALNELENDGYGSTSAIQDLVNGVNAIAGAGTYAIITPSGNISTDQITVGMIYKPGKVTPVGAAATMANGYGSGAFDLVGRKPLAQTYVENATGEKFTLVANHFKSKGSSSGGAGDTDASDGQALSNGTRTRQAQDLITWLATKPTGTTDPDYLVVGDLNAYAMEDPLTTLASGGYNAVVPNTFYSYVFDGQVGSLDHALANSTLSTQVAGATKWHINSDEPNVLDYNTEFKTAGQVTSLYNADQYRTSDHDPVIVGLNLTSMKIAAKVILEGPYIGATGPMAEDLRAANLIPTTEPYTGLSGFTHSNGGGGETTTLSIINNNAIVDWVFIELRSSPTTVVATKSTLLQADGDIVDAADGISPIKFDLPTGNYYFMVRHRNHLRAMTAAALAITVGVTQNIDFTTTSTAIYGSDVQTTIGTKTCLRAGDINQSYDINATDRSATWNDKNLTGYLISDCSLNGTVDATDRSQTWNNKNSTSQF